MAGSPERGAPDYPGPLKNRKTAELSNLFLNTASTTTNMEEPEAGIVSPTNARPNEALAKGQCGAVQKKIEIKGWPAIYVIPVKRPPPRQLNRVLETTKAYMPLKL
ncbi:hypothetical protein NDU88_004214 [Pleurodeles waltl]|uniref:Uncharacterized protein n=1 Tax=Pleurodeles waltl TaxID=8319 RepID=A0AAV7W8D9_PLEWA|nr:hypothetical protein NDU88_004214 [Pleurodeles waltl]